VEIVRKLRAWGIAHHFDILALNSVVGFQKPDARLYEWAIDQAGCRPHDAIMVGNRLDMDIVPAENLGMRTILLQWPAEAKGWEPADEEARLYVQSLCRTPNWPSVGRAGGADRAVHDAVGLMTAIRELTFA
jgi:FMN phosphatase YigB (HAD superfamily)